MSELIDRCSGAWDEAARELFCAEYWEQRPTRLPMPRDGPFLALGELFDLLVAARGGERVAADRFWIARRDPPRHRRDDFLAASLQILGPQPADHGFEGFFRRLGSRSAGINVHRLDRSRPELWDRLRGLTVPIGAASARAIRRWDLDTFLGTYRITPFGAHQDNASVFSFCLLGERTYCTWPPDYNWNPEALHTPDPDLLAPHLERAERFPVRAGELFYWPSNRWHLALSDGSPSVVVQASAYLAKD